MDEATGVELAEPPAIPDPRWSAPDRRRTLQLVLATLWLIDAVLQLQPAMFSRSFGLLMLGPTANGNPAPIAHSIAHVARTIGNHPVGANAAFVVVQLLIAFGIANRRTVRIGLAGSIAWSLLVWWLGEGLGGVFAGTASPLTGAPGAVLLYAVLAVLLWPGGGAAAPFTAASPFGARIARVIWLVVWGSLGLIALAGPATRHPLRLSAGLAAGEPGWLDGINRHLADAAAGHGTALAVTVGVVLLAVGLGVFVPGPGPRATVVAAVVLGLVLWVAGEALGQLFSGSATDPNTGPLLVLLAVAFWPPRHPRSAPAPLRPGTLAVGAP